MKKLLTATFASLALFVCGAAAQTLPSSKVLDPAKLIDDVRILSADDMQGRAIGTPGGEKAREFVVKRFKESGIEPLGDAYLQKFTVTARNKKQYNGANVIGMIKGKKFPDRYLVVSAHYDHVGVRNGEIYNGADDNASGTAALFAIAAYFKKHQPENSIIFAAFDGEEVGLVGSAEFVKSPPVPLAKIVANLNMDMIGHNDKGELYATGTTPYPFLKEYVETAAKNSAIKLLMGHDRPDQGKDDWTNQSDQGSFNRAGVPFIYFGVEDHKDYHKPTDDLDTLTKPFYVHAAEIVLDAVKIFDKNAAAIAKASGRSGK